MKASEQSEKRGSRIKELLYEFYAQILMQNNFSFPVWFICYVISYAQMLDFLFHPFFDSMTSESFISSIILNVFEYTSVSPPCNRSNSSEPSYPTKRWAWSSS